jgi:hypothetical protein
MFDLATDNMVEVHAIMPASMPAPTRRTVADVLDRLDPVIRRRIATAKTGGACIAVALIEPKRMVFVRTIGTRDVRKKFFLHTEKKILLSRRLGMSTRHALDFASRQLTPDELRRRPGGIIFIPSNVIVACSGCADDNEAMVKDIARELGLH